MLSFESTKPLNGLYTTVDALDLVVHLPGCLPKPNLSRKVKVKSKVDCRARSSAKKWHKYVVRESYTLDEVKKPVKASWQGLI